MTTYLPDPNVAMLTEVAANLRLMLGEAPEWHDTVLVLDYLKTRAWDFDMAAAPHGPDQKAGDSGPLVLLAVNDHGAKALAAAVWLTRGDNAQGTWLYLGGASIFAVPYAWQLLPELPRVAP